MLLLEAIISALFLAANSVVAENGFHVTITDDQKNVKDGSVHRKAGQRLSLNCSVTPSIKPPPIITWYKNDNLPFSVANTSNQWLVNDHINTTSLDGGYYKCEAKKQTATIFVNMEGKPVIINCCGRVVVTGTPMVVSSSNVLTLKCYGTGWPEPTFRWLHNGIEIKEDIGKKLGTYLLQHVQNGLMLTFFGIMKQDGGKYICEAKNSYGTDTRTISVIVLEGRSGDPVIKSTHSTIHANIGQSNVTLSCIGERVRKLDADTNWLYNGKDLVQENGSNKRLVFETHYYDQRTEGVKKKVKMSLTIKNVTEEDHGNYTCEVTVLDKVVNSTILLTVGENEPKKDAKTFKIQQIIALAIGIVISVAVIIAVVIFCRKKRKNIERPKIPNGPFKYGAFITYSSQDYAWVKDNLLPLLKENGIETCIHYRNFDIGALLEQNMVNCVYNSRVVIVIMSKSYMKSKYCRSELDYAVHRSVEEPDANSLITLRIDKDIKESKLPKGIRNKTFLDVASDVEKDTWKKRLLIHVKNTGADQNRNFVNNVDDEKSMNSENIDAEQEALIDHYQDNVV